MEWFHFPPGKKGRLLIFEGGVTFRILQCCKYPFSTCSWEVPWRFTSGEPCFLSTERSSFLLQTTALEIRGWETKFLGFFSKNPFVNKRTVQVQKKFCITSNMKEKWSAFQSLINWFRNTSVYALFLYQ